MIDVPSRPTRTRRRSRGCTTTAPARLAIAAAFCGSVACAPSRPLVWGPAPDVARPLVLATTSRLTAAPTSAPDEDTTSTDPRAVQPERPTVATHAGTVATGFLEVETGVEHDRFEEGPNAVAIATVFKFGLAPRAQLSVQVPVAASGESGVGDVSLGVKWRFLEGHPLVSDVAIFPTIKFATGGVRGTHTTDVGLLAINSYSLGPVALDLNAGVTWRSGDGTEAPTRAAVWTASAAIPVRGLVGLALELFGFPGTSGPAGSDASVAVLAGPTFLVRRDLSLDVGLIHPLQGPQPRALYAGLVKNFGRLVGSGATSQ